MGNTNEKPETDQARAKVKDRWDKWDIVARILSYFLTPLLVVIIGGQIQTSLTQRTVDKDYVVAALSILGQPPEDTDLAPALRTWAVDVLNECSPVKFEPEVQEALISGTTYLPVCSPIPLEQSLRTPLPTYRPIPIPQGDLVFDPESPVSIGAEITVTASATLGPDWEAYPDFLLQMRMRMSIDGLPVFETDESQDTYIWDTSEMSQGSHILRLEVTALGSDAWFTVRERIYTLK
jgi:hypothetical protein